MNLRVLFVLGALAIIAIKAISQETYPYHFTYDGNPLVRNHGAADPDVHVWDGVVWMFTSQDRTMDPAIHSFHYAAMDGYHAFSSTDMINWTDHGEIFHSSMMDESLWGSVPKNWMWAPGASRKQDENGVWTYYLYYPKNISFTGQNWVTGVANAPTPYGPFTDQGPLRGGKIAMDPMVFIDDDGEAYIYANNGVVARLKPDMMTLAESPRKIDYAPQSVLNDQNLRFSEGAYMHKRNGVYYFSYSNFHNSTNQAFYAMGDSPYGPFEWKGPFSGNPQGAQDHHSVIEFEGQWYYFYHITYLGLPVRKEGQGRIASYERLYYNPDGTMQMVVLTTGPKKILNIDAPHGYINLSPPGGAYNTGTEVTVTLTDEAGYAFHSWSGDHTGFENPVKIVMNSNKNIVAHHVATPPYAITSIPLNGTVSFDPPGSVYDEGTVVTLTAAPNNWYEFTGWGGDLSGLSNPATITMNSNKRIYAFFKKMKTPIPGLIKAEIFDRQSGIQLQTSSEGGQQVAYINNGNWIEFDVEVAYAGAYSVDFRVAAGTNGGAIDIQADGQSIGSVNVPNTGGWSSWITVSTEINFPRSGEHSLRLNFLGGDGFLFNLHRMNFFFSEETLKLSTTAINGSISMNPPWGIYTEGTVVTLTAIPEQGYRFIGWADDLSGSNNPSSITMDADKTVTALFEPLPSYNLSTTATYGIISLNPAGGSYYDETVVTLTAVGDLGYKFQSWGGDLSGTANPVKIIMDSDKTISATFTPIPLVKLITESENGTIALDPPGGNYYVGTNVILTAVPGQNYFFKTWGGDLSGSVNPVTLLMDSDKTVSATFSGKPVISVRIGNILNKILVTGETHQLSAIINPVDAFDQSITWSSSNNAVATVDENGIITAISQGTATIAVTTNDGGYKHTCNVGIMSSGVPVTDVTISGCPLVILKVDSTYQLGADITPANAGDLRVSWSSSDEAVASVDASGLVKALSGGEATIAVTTNLGGFTNACTITVDAQTNSRNIDVARQFVVLYPNPVSETLHFKFSESVSEKKIDFYNVMGQLLLSKTTNQSQPEIDIRKFSTEGLLIVKVVSGESVDSFKVTVKK